MVDVRDRLTQLEDELMVVEAQLGDPDVVADRVRFADVGRRHSELSEIVAAGRAWRQAADDLDEVNEMLHESSADDRDELRELAADAEREAGLTDERFKFLLLPRDPNDAKNVILEIRGAEGGEEANLFARDLFEMYRIYASTNKWTVETLEAHASDMGGFSDVAVVVKGKGAWSRLKHEGGPHRVQRVPVTESQGRVHTSSATVTVLPEAEEVDIEIDPNDLKIDVYRASGPGGQSVNTTDSAVRIRLCRCRTRRANYRTRTRPFECSAPDCFNDSKPSRLPRNPRQGRARSEAEGGQRRSGHTTSRRTGSPITASA